MRITSLIITACLLLFSGCKHGGTTEPPKPDEKDPYPLVDGGETVPSILPVECTQVARVIGNTPAGETLPNPNATLKRFNMASTDFGNMWDAGNGSVFCVFGDNFNDRGGDWLSNAVAITTDKDLWDGLYYDSMLWNKSTNKRMEIIPKEGYEITCIPTGAFSVLTNVGTRQYVSYMAIKQWKVGGDNDSWSAHHSELVYSDDFGATWKRSGVKWDGGSNFVQTAFVVLDDMVYMWGTPSGRHGGVYAAKVSPSKVLDKASYQYWNGSSWVAEESAAVPVANGEISEFSVRFNSYYKRFMMIYLDVRTRKLVFRDAAAPEGEWSGEKTLLDRTYGPSIHPWFCDGRDFWFVSSDVTNNGSLDTWHIFLYHAYLTADEDGFNILSEPGFENDPDQRLGFRTLWNVSDAMSTHDTHSGDIACRLANQESGVWKDACTQTVRLKKNTNYTLSGYAKASVAGHTGAYLGIRLEDGRIVDLNPALSPEEWTKIEVSFNTGSCLYGDVFFGTLGAEGLTVTVDDIHLQ